MHKRSSSNHPIRLTISNPSCTVGHFYLHICINRQSGGNEINTNQQNNGLAEQWTLPSVRKNIHKNTYSNDNMKSLCIMCIAQWAAIKSESVKLRTKAPSLQNWIINDSTHLPSFVFTLYSTMSRCLGFVFMSRERQEQEKRGRKHKQWHQEEQGLVSKWR